MKADKLRKIVLGALDELKGRDVVCLMVSEITTITDFMIVATGTSTRHVNSLTEEVVRKVKEAGGTVNSVEGKGPSEWILIDLGDVIVHVMLEETRQMYDLESLWSMTPASSE